MFAWLVATNHCATAMIGSEDAAKSCHVTVAAAASGHEECPDHHAGNEKKDAPDDSVACCKDFSKAAQPDNASPQFKNVVVKLVTYFGAVQLLPAPPKADINPHYLDSGPPASFAESVLHRSVLAHAPPLLG